MLMLVGCSRRDTLDAFPVSEVNIVFDWKELGDKVPQKIRILFYPINSEGKVVDKVISNKGETLEIPLGRYSVVAYNSDAQNIRIKGDESFSTIEAYTDIYSTKRKNKNGVWCPDLFYVISESDLYIDGDEKIAIRLQPRLRVKTYCFKLKVEGLQYVSSISGSVDGLASRYYLGLGQGRVTDDQICFEVENTTDDLTGIFTAFENTDNTNSRLGSDIMLNLIFIKVDNSVQTIEMNITKAIEDVDQNGGDTGETPRIIDLPTGGGVKIEEPSDSVIIDGNVNDWDIGTNTEVPVV